jgi:hypothetical protein
LHIDNTVIALPHGEKETTAEGIPPTKIETAGPIMTDATMTTTKIRRIIAEDRIGTVTTDEIETPNLLIRVEIEDAIIAREAELPSQATPHPRLRRPLRIGLHVDVATTGHTLSQETDARHSHPRSVMCHGPRSSDQDQLRNMMEVQTLKNFCKSTPQFSMPLAQMTTSWLFICQPR